MEIVCGFVFADVIFRRRDTKAGNTSVFAGWKAAGMPMIFYSPSKLTRLRQRLIIQQGYIRDQRHL